VANSGSLTGFCAHLAARTFMFLMLHAVNYGSIKLIGSSNAIDLLDDSDEENHPSKTSY